MNSPITNAAPASNGQVVVFPPDRGIGVLAVAPPYPPGFKPQNDGALGININMVHGDRDGLLVYILAYLNMAIGDSIKVFIETKNAPVADFSVTEAHFDAQGNAKNIPFYISAKNMEAKFLPLLSENKDFWIEIQRVGGNIEDSLPVPLLYKYPAPGEADTDGGKPFNQGLKLPVASESVVDQTVINDGMFVTVLEYFNQNIGDVVVLAFGSLLLESTVTELGDVVFELTPQMLASLAPTSSLVVRWEVFDVVENSSGWSDALILTFKPGVVLLAAPIFEQADPDNVVNHDELAGGAMVILVTGVFAKNDLIELTLEGLTKSGDPATRTFSVTLTAASRAVDFPVPNEWVRNLIGGSARASYTLTKAGKLQRSKPADATFTGTSLPLGLPIVSPLVDNTLPVDTATATVQVADYWPLKIGATVKLKWQTTDQDGIVALFLFQVIVTALAQPIIFQVPAKYIAPYASTPLTVQSTVTNPGEVEVFSGLLQLRFGDVAQIVLEPPFLVSPATEPIDPLGDVPTVRVEFLAAIAGDQARLVERQAPVGSESFPRIPLNQNKRANFVLSRGFLVARQGTTSQLFWNLNRGGERAASSESLAMTIKPITAEDPRLPTPEIQGATTVLDVATLPPTAQLVVDVWAGQVKGHRVWLCYEGTTHDGSATTYNDRTGEPHTEGSGLKRLVPLEWLKTLAHDSVLKISFWVNLKGESDFERAVLFPICIYTIKSLVLTAPTLLDVPLSDRNLDFDDIPDSGARIQVSAYTGMSIGQSVRVVLVGAGKNYESPPQEVRAVAPLIFLIPRPILIANSGQPIVITYWVSASSNQSDGVQSPPLNLTVLADTWRDSITDFNGHAGGWAFGTASRTARIVNGYYENLTYDGAGNAGVLLSQTFQFKAARTYRFTYYVQNVGPQSFNVPPVISVSTSNGLVILGAYTAPSTGAFIQQTSTFRVPVSGSYTIYIISHEDRGGYAGPQGGNDFFLDNILVQRV
jgi:hypothetical protein